MKAVGQYLVCMHVCNTYTGGYMHGICNHYYLHVDMHCAESEVLLARK